MSYGPFAEQVGHRDVDMHDLVVRLVYKALIPASTAIAYNDTTRVRTGLRQLGPLSACRTEGHVAPKGGAHFLFHGKWCARR